MDPLRAADVAKLLGVSRERVRQIAHADPTFPSPVETDPFRWWDRAEVERWAAVHWRVRGRSGRLGRASLSA